MNLKNRFIISIEGIDGVGKSTLTKKLAQYLQCDILEKPLATKIGIEEYTRQKEEMHKIGGKQLIDFYISSYEFINNYDRIVTDRYIGSLYSWGVDDSNKEHFFESLKKLPLPTVAIFLIGDPEVIYKRALLRDGNDIDARKANLSFIHLDKYKEIYKKLNVPFIIIDTKNLDQDEVFNLAVSELSAFLGV